MLGELALGGLDLAPLIKWPGGKYRFVNRFKHRIPPHRVYVEPFFGGGSFFFGKPEAPLSILGDMTDRTVKFHVAVRNGALRACRGGVRATLAVHAKQKAGKKLTACETMAASFVSYHGGSTPGQKAVGKWMGAVRLKRLNQYEGMLRRAHITRGDFERTVKLGDKKGGKDAFFFLDPPWPVDYSRAYGRIGGGTDKGLPLARVRQVMDRVKGRVWVVYNDAPEVRRAFTGGKWRRYRVMMSINYVSRGKGMNKKVPWLLATNYDIKRGTR